MATYSVVKTEPPASLDDVLAGRLGSIAVRGLAREPLRHGVGELLDQCLSGAPAGALVLQRTKYKPGRKLTAYYSMSPKPGAVARHLAVRWHAAPNPIEPVRVEAQAEDRGGSDGFACHAATSGDGRVALLVSPADPSMPQLQRLHRRGHLAGLLAVNGRRASPSIRLDIDTIRYRPGERHVLRVTFGDPSSVAFVKTDRDDAGAHSVSIATALGAALPGRCAGAGVAEPVRYVADDRAAIWRCAPGRPLRRRLLERPAEGPALLSLLGRAVRAIHDDADHVAATLTGDVRAVLPRDGYAEAALTLRAGEHIAALLPSAGRVYEGLVSDVVRDLDRWSPEAPTLTHGDLKCDNVIAADGQIRLLDFDRSCLADPALDLGKLVADLRWWSPARGRRGDELVAAFRSGYGPCDDARWRRAALLATLFQLKLAARRCAVHDERWESAVQDRIGAAAAGLARQRAHG